MQTLYFAESLPFTVVNLMSVVFFKGLGASNQFIGLTSLLYIPWVIKLFWGPVVEFYSTRRRWIIATEMGMTGLVAALALGVLSPRPIELVLGVLILVAFVSATHDIAVDGFYLDVLDKGEQAFFVGIRSTAYKLAWLVGAGGLVYVAGRIGQIVDSQPRGWSLSFALGAMMLFTLLLFHVWYLPGGKTTRPSRHTPSRSAAEFLRIFSTYFRQPRVVPIVVYILIFRLGDAFMLKMAQPFLMDLPEKGGLGLSTAQVGVIYGTVGTCFLLVGGILGGVLVARGGLKTWMWPLALIQNLSIILYWFLAVYRPGIPWVVAVNSFEQLAYGLGVSAYTVFLMRTVQAEYKAAHYAIATGLMAVGVMVPGVVSGFLAVALGYANFFLVSFAVAIPGLLVIFFLPYKELDAQIS